MPTTVVTRLLNILSSLIETYLNMYNNIDIIYIDYDMKTCYSHFFLSLQGHAAPCRHVGRVYEADIEGCLHVGFVEAREGSSRVGGRELRRCQPSFQRSIDIYVFTFDSYNYKYGKHNMFKFKLLRKVAWNNVKVQ